MFPVGRLATSASQNPQPQLNGFVHEIFGYRHTRDLHESTFIYNIVAIHSTFLNFHAYCIRELIPRMINLMKTRPFRTETD